MQVLAYLQVHVQGFLEEVRDEGHSLVAVPDLYGVVLLELELCYGLAVLLGPRTGVQHVVCHYHISPVVEVLGVRNITVFVFLQDFPHEHAHAHAAC